MTSVLNRTSPRTDCPTVLPDPPAQTPSQIGIPQDGSGPVSDLQRLMLLLAEGAANEILGSPVPAAEALAVEERLRAEGHFANGAAAGEYAMGRMREILSLRKAAEATAAADAVESE